jgi:hypothetical protein
LDVSVNLVGGFVNDSSSLSNDFEQLFSAKDPDSVKFKIKKSSPFPDVS